MRRGASRESDLAFQQKEILPPSETLPAQFNITVGERIQVQTNIYPLAPAAIPTGLYQYSVNIQPEIGNERMARHFVYTALCPDGGNMSENERWGSIIFDGMSTIYSLIPDLDIEVEIPAQSETPVKVIIKKVGDFTIADTQSFMQICGTALNKAHRALGLETFKHKWLDFNDISKISSLNVISGFVPSITSLAHGISYVVDTTSHINREGSVYNMLEAGIGSQSKRADLFSMVKDLQVVTIHSKRQRVISISGIQWDTTPSRAFFERVDRTTNEKTTVSLEQYFQEVYNFTVKNDDPIIEFKYTSNGEERVDLFPASALKVAGIMEYEKMDEQFMQKVREASSLGPASRKKKLDEFIEKLNENTETSSLLKRWGVKVNESLSVQAHVLPPPVLKARTRNADHKLVDIKSNDRMSFRKDMRNIGVAVPPKLNSKPVIITPESCATNVKNQFIPKFMEMARAIDVQFQEPDIRIVSGTQENWYKHEIVQYIHQYGTPSFVVVIFPDMNKDRYDGVKNLLTVQLGIPSQFVKSTTVFGETSNASVYLNLLLQITAKTGGIPYYCSSETIRLSHTMVVGIAVDNGRSSSAPVCAMTASYDQTLARYKSASFTLQEHDGVVPAEHIKAFLEKAVRRYTEYMGEPPHGIVVYRSGVSYGLMNRVRSVEIEACKEVIGDTPLLYALVQKNCPIKIMGSNGDRVENVKPGTVVTEKISTSGLPEFYMVSHDAGKEQMAAPTRYTIIYHYPVKWKDDHVAQLTHYLTCQYANWPGAIRVPCPLMLAAKLAELCRTRLGCDAPCENLTDFLHFI